MGGQGCLNDVCDTVYHGGVAMQRVSFFLNKDTVGISETDWHCQSLECGDPRGVKYNNKLY